MRVMNNVVQSVDCLTGKEVKRFYEDGLIKSSGGDFWLRDGGTDFNPGRAGMFSEISEQVCTCDARAERVQFRPAIRLNNGGITQGIQPGDVLEFTNPSTQNKYRFTFLGVGDDNHFVALADEPVQEMAFSKSRNNDAYDYDKSDVKKLADEHVLVNIRTYDCEIIHKEHEKQKSSDIDTYNAVGYIGVTCGKNVDIEEARRNMEECLRYNDFKTDPVVIKAGRRESGEIDMDVYVMLNIPKDSAYIEEIIGSVEANLSQASYQNAYITAFSQGSVEWLPKESTLEEAKQSIENSRYEDEQAIVDELKDILDNANPSFMSVAFGKEISARQMVHDAVYYLTPVVPEEILADKTYTGASCQPFTKDNQIAGIAQMYGFEEEPPYAPSTVTEIYELSEDSIATLIGYAHNIINEKYSDIAALEPATLKKIDGYVINPEAADRKLRENGQGELADKLKEAYGWNEQKQPRAVKKNYIELIRDLAPVFEGEDKKIEQEV